MKPLTILFAVSFALAAPVVHAQKGMPAEERDTIHGLFDSHEKIQREVTVTDDGYTAKTTSADPEVARLLQSHVDQMKKRLGDGLMVRRWDPAFSEFVEQYDDMDISIESIDGGAQVTARGKTETASKVLRNHAGIISRFVEHGWAEHDKEHPAVATLTTGTEDVPRECCLKTDGKPACDEKCVKGDSTCEANCEKGKSAEGEKAPETKSACGGKCRKDS